MSNTFGALYIQGQQTNLPGGGIQGIGQFAVPASGTQDTPTCQCTAASTFTLALPTSIAPVGALVIPPSTASGTIKIKTVSGDSGIFVSPSYPTWICFDPSNLPTNLYITCSVSQAIVVQFI